MMSAPSWAGWPGRSRLIALWAVIVAAVWGVAFYLARYGPPPVIDVEGARSAVDVLSAWDGTHYRLIATRGYSFVGPESRHLVFFPLFPFLARALGGPRHAVLAGILISQFCLLGSLVLLRRLGRGAPGHALRREPGLWLLVTPAGFFLSVFYADSLFLLLTLAMYAAYISGRFRLSALAGVLAGLTRPTALTIPVLFAWDLVGKVRRREPWLGAGLAAASPLLGIALYAGFVGWGLGTPFAYTQLQADWSHEWQMPFLRLAQTARFALSSSLAGSVPPANELVRLFSTAMILALLAWGHKRIEPGLLAYTVVTLIFLHSQFPQNASTARYELALFPVYVLAAQSAVSHRVTAPIVATLLLVIQFSLLVDFGRWRWVA